MERGITWRWWSSKDKENPRPKKYDEMKLISSDGTWVLHCYGGDGKDALGKTAERRELARLIQSAPELRDMVEDLIKENRDRNLVRRAKRLLSRIK